MKNLDVTASYLKACRTDFWQKVFQIETDYLVEYLKGCCDVLSIGCGPAIIEGELSKRGFNVAGLDVSLEALNCASAMIRTVAARAEDLPFPESTFDAVIYVASLQFVENYRVAIDKTTSVLRPKGTLLVMLINPDSDFFNKKLLDPSSYIRRIRHTNLMEIEGVIAEKYNVRTEYLLGVKGETVYESQDKKEAVLYALIGTKKLVQSKDRELGVIEKVTRI